jgi:GxxExxY protein
VASRGSDVPHEPLDAAQAVVALETQVAGVTATLAERGIEVERQVPTTVFFHDQPVGEFRADIIVNRRIMLQLKALPRLEPSHDSQIINALRATALEVGLLLNFRPKPDITQMSQICADQRVSS